MLEGILTKKPSKSLKVARLVSSIGQDLIYHTSNYEKKHRSTQLFLLNQKKNGIKSGYQVDEQVWSRDLILETNLALEHAKDQEHKSFTPAIIQFRHLLLSYGITMTLQKVSTVKVCIARMAL